MAINKNHEFEELNGIKCAVVEKNVSAERLSFLKPLLEFNGYTVVTQDSPPPKAAGPAAGATEATPAETPPAPATVTLGVTDVSFNSINAIFGRLLKTPDGRIVTLNYWQQKEKIARDYIPYYENRL